MLRRVFLAAVLFAVSLALIGCQTVQGLGKDIEWVGQKGSEVVGQ